MQQETMALMRVAAGALREASQKIDSETINLRGAGDPIELARHYLQLVRGIETVKGQLKAITELENDLNQYTIPDLFRDKAVKSPTIDGHRVTVAWRNYCSMLDKDAAKDWLRENGFGDIIIETVPAPSLTSRAVDYAEEHGRDFPDNLFKVSRSPYVSVTPRIKAEDAP